MIHTIGLPEPEIPKRVPVPDFAHLLPAPIQRFTTKGVYDAEDETHLSFTQGGGHGGSHPHLVHAWLSAIKGDRPALPDAEDLGQLDHGRHLRPRIGPKGGREGRHPDVLIGPDFKAP